MSGLLFGYLCLCLLVCLLRWEPPEHDYIILGKAKLRRRSTGDNWCTELPETACRDGVKGSWEDTIRRDTPLGEEEGLGLRSGWLLALVTESLGGLHMVITACLYETGHEAIS